MRNRVFAESMLIFPGDLPAYGISYADAGGNLRRFAIEVSGYDGSVLLEEADPLETQFILPGEISRQEAGQGRFRSVLPTIQKNTI